MDRQHVKTAVFPEGGRVAFPARKIVESFGAAPEELEQKMRADARPEGRALDFTVAFLGGAERFVQGPAVEIRLIAGPVVIDNIERREVLLEDGQRRVRDDFVEHDHALIAPGQGADVTVQELDIRAVIVP